MSTEKADYLLKEVDENIKVFERRKNKHKNKAFYLKLVIVACSASITTLLGLKDMQVGSLFINISIILGGLVTILNFVDGFYNHKELWIKDGHAYIELLELKRDLMFYVKGRDCKSFEDQELERFKARLNEIVHTSAVEWHKIHLDKKEKEGHQ